jgi:putative transcriptional regulator
MDETETLRGKLLVAGAGLFDPNFRQTVVLMAQHGPEGALGVVLNRPGPVPAAQALPDLTDVVPSGEPLFMGGPVQPEAAVVVADFEDPSAAGELVIGSIGIAAGALDASVLAAMRRARVFAGYAGWGPGQLESELEESAWLVENAAPDDVFSDKPERLWRNVLKRKGGAHVVLAMMPFDPSTN